VGGIYDSIEEKTNISNIEKKNKKSVEIPIRYKVFFLFSFYRYYSVLLLTPFCPAGGKGYSFVDQGTIVSGLFRIGGFNRR
jgi:hypothetical protein